MIYLIISVILDLLLSNIVSTSYQNLDILFPMIFISSIPISYLLTKNKRLFLILLIIISLIYDLLFSSIFFINAIYIILYYLIINFFYKRNNSTFINIFIISILGILIYDFYLFLVLNLISYSNFSINDYYYKVGNSFLFNSFYITFSIIILKSRIFGSRKKKLFK